MIRVETSAELVNRITNDPQVLPYVSRHGSPIDWTPAVESPDCVVLSNGADAAMVLERTAPRDWQVNTIFAPTCRGKRAVETGLEMKAFATQQYADLIFGSIPNALPQAQWFYRKLGGVPVSRVKSGGYIYRAQEGETLFRLSRPKIGVTRTRDQALLERVANHPDIKPWLGISGGQPVNIEPGTLERDDILCLEGTAGLMVLGRERDGVWQKHNLFVPGALKDKLETAREMFGWIFVNTEAPAIIARTPVGNRQARWFNRQIGMRSAGFFIDPALGQVEEFRKDRPCH